MTPKEYVAWFYEKFNDGVALGIIKRVLAAKEKDER